MSPTSQKSIFTARDAFGSAKLGDEEYKQQASGCLPQASDLLRRQSTPGAVERECPAPPAGSLPGNTLAHTANASITDTDTYQHADNTGTTSWDSLRAFEQH